MQYLHELQADHIQVIIKNGPWHTAGQSLTSAQTNDNNLPELDHRLLETGENTAGINAFADINFGPAVNKIVDIGGGRFDVVKKYMTHRGVEVVIWDPYNRSLDHNSIVQDEIKKNKVLAATSMSILNVIPELAVRIAHISTLKDALLLNGKAYFKIWQGEGRLQGSFLASWNNDSFQANASRERFLREVQLVFGIRNVELSHDIPNLIIATKQSDKVTSLEEIQKLQQLSTRDLAFFTLKKSEFLSKDVAKTDLLGEHLFFKTSIKTFLETSRFHKPMIQEAYDRRNGLVCIA